MKVLILTLGCRVNQFDTALMEDILRTAGHEIVVEGDGQGRDGADVYIINSCVVTGKSETQTRRLAKSLSERNPQAKIILTGCAVNKIKENIKDYIKFVDQFVPNEGKNKIVEFIEKGSQVRDEDFPVIKNSAYKTRANLKVQDGCNNRCSYCIVPSVRGKSRSYPIDWVLRQVQSYEMAGIKEIVITGIHLGDYGRDSGGSLSELVELIIKNSNTARIRLSSVDPHEIDDRLITLFSTGRLCRHIHMPVQSGSNKILTAMNRRYNVGNVMEITEKLKSSVPEIQIGADIIAGFPGEDEKDHDDTVQLLSGLPIDYLHVFPFSPRPDTPITEKPYLFLHADLIKNRAERLKRLSAEKKRLFLEAQTGKKLHILCENITTKQFTGYSDNYIKVYVKEKKDAITPNEYAIVKVIKPCNDYLEARLI